MTKQSTRRFAAIFFLGLATAGCEIIADFDRSKIPPDDGGVADGSTVEGGGDGTSPEASPPVEAGPGNEASAPDGNVPDTGTPDGNAPDTGTPDTGAGDGSAGDSGNSDSSAGDSGSSDSSTPETGSGGDSGNDGSADAASE